jgi:hypothetical protein
MVRLCCAAVLGCLVLVARPALAQEGSKDGLKKLEVDVAKLRVQLNDLESRLQKIKGTTAKQAVTTPAAHSAGFGWIFARMQDKTASCQKTQAQAKGKAVSEEKGLQSHWTGWARHGWHGSHWAGHHFGAMHWAGHHGRHESERSGTASVEQRLDHIMRELAALRHDLHKTK